MSEDAKYRTDYFRYLEAPENATRYTTALDHLSRRHWSQFQGGQFQGGQSQGGRPLRVLDLGCGTATLAAHLPVDSLSRGAGQYHGVDHDPVALTIARERFPDAAFTEDDNPRFLALAADRGERWDAVVLAGVLFHQTRAETGEHHDDIDVLRACLRVLNPGGRLVLLAPFAYTRAGGHDFWTRASWKRATTVALLDRLRPEATICYEAITVQIGLEHRLATQHTAPDWFVRDPDGVPHSPFHGHYLATLTLMVAADG